MIHDSKTNQKKKKLIKRENMIVSFSYVIFSTSVNF